MEPWGTPMIAKKYHSNLLCDHVYLASSSIVCARVFGLMRNHRCVVRHTVAMLLGQQNRRVVSTGHLYVKGTAGCPSPHLILLALSWSQKKILGLSHNAQCFYVILDQLPIMLNAFMMTRINSANFLHTA